MKTGSTETLNLRRPVPLWLFIVSLLVVAAISSVAFYLPKLLSPPDFQLSLDPASLYVRPEPVSTSSSFEDANSSGSLVTVKSLNGFSGAVSISATFPNGVRGNAATSTVLLGSDAALFGLNATTTIRVGATSLGDYSVTVVAASGSLVRSASITVHSQDVSVQVGQTTLRPLQGSSVESQITYSSLNQFAGNLTLTETPHMIYPNGPCPYFGRCFINSTLSTSSVILNGRSTSSVILTIAVGDFVPAGNYTFTTITAYGGWTWQEQVRVGVAVAPEPSLTLDGYSYSSDTNATLILRNGGPAAIEITSYTVTDSAGDRVTGCFGFPIPMGCYLASFIGQNDGGAINVLTAPLCGYCSLSGSSFTYQPGQTYTIVLTTSRQNSFTHSITR